MRSGSYLYCMPGINRWKDITKACCETTGHTEIGINARTSTCTNVKARTNASTRTGETGNTGLRNGIRSCGTVGSCVFDTKKEEVNTKK